jgi:hypothetical protein
MHHHERGGIFLASHPGGSAAQIASPPRHSLMANVANVASGSAGSGLLIGASTTGSPSAFSRRTAMMSLKRKSAHDERLQQQYIYFRMEFINAASNYGVTLPLDILEDNSGRVINFVRQSGPEFLLQLLLTEISNIHLLRMALSLLVVTLSLLRRCIPQSEGGTAELSVSASFSQSSTDWLRQSTKRLCDGGAVSVCVQLLLSTYLKDIHELIVGLLGQIVCTSKEAAGQMLSPLNSHLDNIDAHGNHDLSRSPIDSHSLTQKLVSSSKNGPGAASSGAKSARNLETGGGTTASGGSNASSNDLARVLSKETTCLSFLISVCALYRNRLTVLASCADIMVSIMQAFPAAIVALRIAQTPTCTLSVMSHVNGKSNAQHNGPTAHSSLLGGSGTGAGTSPRGLQSMNINSPRSILGNAALNNVGSENTTVYRSPRMTGSSLSSTGGGGERFCYDRSPELEQPTGSVAIPWAGIKLMLRVVMRMITFSPVPTSSSNSRSGEHSRHNSPGTSPMMVSRVGQDVNYSADDGLSLRSDKSAQINTEGCGGGGNGPATDTAALLQRVYYCVTHLLSLSPEVASFVGALPGADEMLTLATSILRQRADTLNEDMTWAVDALDGALTAARVAVHSRRPGTTVGTVSSHFSGSNIAHSQVNMPTPNYKAAGARMTPLYLTPIEAVVVKPTRIQSLRKMASRSSVGNMSVKSSDSVSVTSLSGSPQGRHPNLEVRQPSFHGSNKSPSSKIISATPESPQSMERKSRSPKRPTTRTRKVHMNKNASPHSRCQTAPHNTRVSGTEAPHVKPACNVILVSDFYAEARANGVTDSTSRDGSSIRSSTTNQSYQSLAASTAGSLSSAQSVSWLFKATAQRPQLPVVVVGQSSPVQSVLANSGKGPNSENISSLTRPEETIIENGAVYDNIADKELKRLLRKGKCFTESYSQFFRHPLWSIVAQVITCMVAHYLRSRELMPIYS